MVSQPPLISKVSLLMLRHINDVHRNIQNHRQDFRLLWGEVPYYEGQLFNDITGLEGISTVKVCMPMLIRPIIPSTTSPRLTKISLIPSISRPIPTKYAHGGASWQHGRHAQQSVTNGAFTGILYIVLFSEGCATYAIGVRPR